MLHIAGGTYLEYCAEPHWSQLYGSGLRAAAALSKLSKKIILHTYISRKYARHLELLTNTFGFEVQQKPVSKTFSFNYLHGLSKPLIEPHSIYSEKLPLHTVDEENVLYFGFMERDVVVHGKKVVYDPQSADRPINFRENGSTAKQLAIVANLNEASKLTGEIEITKIGRTLISKHNAEVAIIKRGPWGAVIFTKSGVLDYVPPYKTEFVWPIGSGDVFAAVFAHQWIEKNCTPSKAANLASMATAIFCNSQSLPIPLNFQTAVSFQPLRLSLQKINRKQKAKRVYLAGPFFTMAQRWLIDEARTCLQNLGLSVFSPYHDVGIGAASDVAPLDIKALNKSDLVFVIGEGLDTGTIYETGYAKAKDIPAIVFVQNEKEENLKMLQGMGCEIVNDFVSAIYKTIWLALEM